MRAFVDIEEIADAMPGAMAVVNVFCPDRRSGNRIEQRRKDSARESRTGQRNHAFEHARAVAFLLIGRGTDRHHSGDVGGAAQVLPTRVNQQQTVALDQRVFFFGGVVMRHRPIGVERGDGVEAQ